LHLQLGQAGELLGRRLLDAVTVEVHEAGVLGEADQVADVASADTPRVLRSEGHPGERVVRAGSDRAGHGDCLDRDHRCMGSIG
jgi:hypothetical protein